MRRKTIQLAGKTLVISLPSSWVKSMGIKKGQELEVSVSGGSLVIEQPVPTKGSASVVDLAGLNASLVWHAIVSRYVMGSSEIEVKFRESNIIDPRTGAKISTADAVERVVEGLIGMEIVRQSRGLISIREVSSVVLDEYPNIMRRIWLTCLSMAEEGAAAIRSNDSAGFRTAVKVEKNVNRFALYALRMLHRGISISDLTADARMIYTLEGFADTVASLDNGDAQSISLAAEVLRRAYECWFSPSNEKADRMYSALASLRRRKDTVLVSAAESVVEAAVASFVKK